MILKKPSNDNFYKLEYFKTNSARKAWKNIIENFSNDKELNILLPSYIGRSPKEGSGIFDPIIESKTNFDFYPLNEKLDPEFDAIKKMLLSKKYNLILLVHYFGLRISNWDEIVKLCRDNNLIIVEDCAHYFNYNLYDNYELSDFSIYSLHKFFALNHGGLLISHLESNKFNINRDYLDSSLIDFHVENYDLRKIISKRRDNYIYLYEKLHKETEIKVFKKLNSHDIPQSFPILVDSDIRFDLYLYCIDNSMPIISLYHTLIDEINVKNFSTSFNISKCILNLPVHQNTSFEDLDKLVYRIKEGIKLLKKNI